MVYNKFVLYSHCGEMFKNATKLNWSNIHFKRITINYKIYDLVVLMRYLV